jgi:hypothetical protein
MQLNGTARAVETHESRILKPGERFQNPVWIYNGYKLALADLMQTVSGPPQCPSPLCIKVHKDLVSFLLLLRSGSVLTGVVHGRLTI